jgi:ribosome-associated toxin RatA of RatAB toxin-antitoxin module
VTSLVPDGGFGGRLPIVLCALLLALTVEAGAEDVPPGAAAAASAPLGTFYPVPPPNGDIAAINVPHPDTSVQWGRATVYVNAPLDRVMAVVTDYAAYHTFLPHFRISRVLSQRGPNAVLYVEASIALDTMTLWAQVKLTALPLKGTTHVIEAKMTKGNMDVMGARWELTPLDASHTVVAFQLIMDPRMPMPSGMVSTENLKASKQAVRAVRNLATGRPLPAM